VAAKYTITPVVATTAPTSPYKQHRREGLHDQDQSLAWQVALFITVPEESE
jgi:hypothetical protein